jgi:hypothetical protein
MGDPRAHVALFVDYANLRQQFTARAAGNGAAGNGAAGNGAAGSGAAGADGSTNGSLGPDDRTIADALVAFAQGAGRLGLARAYADWSREPDVSRILARTRLSPVLVPATEDGEDRSHIKLVVEAMECLYNGDEPEAFVLVSSDPSLVPLVQALRGDGSEVVLVATQDAPTAELRAEADDFVSLEEVLEGRTADPVAPREYGERGGQPRGSQGRGARGRRDEERVGYYSNKPLLTESEFGDYDWGGFIGLIDELEQRLPFVGVRYLVNKVLGPHNCGIDDPRIKRDLMNEAVDEGLIEMYTVGNVNDRTDPVTACRLDRHNELVVEILGPEGATPPDPIPEDRDALASRGDYAPSHVGPLG